MTRRQLGCWLLGGAALAASLLYGGATLLRWACEDRCLDGEEACLFDGAERECATKAANCLEACR